MHRVKYLQYLGYVLIACLNTAWGCYTAQDPPLIPQANVHVSLINKAGAASLQLDTATYADAFGNRIAVSKLRYFISKVSLHRYIGESWVEANSYHLVRENDSTGNRFTLSVPHGEYISIGFQVGLSQDGASYFTPRITETGMFWNSSKGFMSLLLEGHTTATTGNKLPFSYQIGGITSPYTTLRMVNLTFTKPLVVTEAGASLEITADVLKLLNSPNALNLMQSPVIDSPGPEAMPVADNYASMFTVVIK